MRRPVFARQPILVVGTARSGTSLTAGSLHLCGAWVGQTVPGGGSENPEGFFENTILRELVVKKLLSSEGVCPLGVKTLPDLSRLRARPKLAQTVLQTIHKQGYQGERPWLFKDAKLSLLWPVWKKAFPDARWIIVRRPREQIIQSCLRTGFMRQHSTDPAFWSDWIDAYRQRLELLKASGVWWREIDTQTLLSGDFSGLHSIADDLGLQWRESSIRSFINPTYWHGTNEGGHSPDPTL